jgi:hypothetical protein
MRCPKCYTETPNEALSCPSCNLQTPRGKMTGPANGKKGGSKGKSSRQAKKVDLSGLLPGRRVLSWVASLIFLGASGFIAYWYVFTTPENISPKSALEAMNQLRRLPSKQEGKTIEDYLNAEMKKSKDAGHLVGFEGWKIKPYERNSYLVSFSFDEKDAKKSAEWVVDPQNKIFTPISELATAVQKQENTN